MTVAGVCHDGRHGAPLQVLTNALVAAVAAILVSSASADVFKCTGPRGQVTYSDSPCPDGTGVRLDLKEPVEDLNPRRPDVAVSAATRPPEVAAAAPTDRRTAIYELTHSDRQRITNLEQFERNRSAYAEQRQSATLEIINIRRGVLARMSLDDLRKKDHHWTDLGSIERDRRRVAAIQLANLFGSYL